MAGPDPRRLGAGAPLLARGVRRVGKTSIAKSIPDATYLNCDLPSVAERLADPERFFRSVTTPVVILDEIHQLPDPSRLLKIGTDEFPKLKILATGSSTHASTTKFKDTLTGRKRVVHLVPVLYEELDLFGIRNLEVRLLHGGLPRELLSPVQDRESYAEWMDSYYARDVQELFRLGKRQEYLKLMELLMRQNGGRVDYTQLAKLAGISRQTVMSWLDVLQITHVITTVTPFSGGGRREITSQPRIYGFDTGLIAYCNGWHPLRTQDCGHLWENVVLEALQYMQIPKIQFWRDKDGREIDFVVSRGRAGVDAIGCKWSRDAFEPASLAAFRSIYPKGRNYVVGPWREVPIVRRVKGMEVTFLDPAALRRGVNFNFNGL